MALLAAAGRFTQAELRIMPTSRPPHKTALFASDQQRLAMITLALQESGLDARVDLRELESSRAHAYTIDSLRGLRAELGDACVLHCLVGWDSFRSLPSWKEWRALFDYANFIVATRGDKRLDDAELKHEFLRREIHIQSVNRYTGGRIAVMDDFAWPWSSSQIRQCLALEPDALPAEYVHDSVRAYLAQQRLYQH